MVKSAQEGEGFLVQAGHRPRRGANARIIQRIFRDFIDSKAVTKIAKEMNDERVPTKARLKGGWNVSTISRILKDEKYIDYEAGGTSTGLKTFFGVGPWWTWDG